jgi:hypothetical protein
MEVTEMPLDVVGTDACPDSDGPFSKYNTSSSAILFPVAERAIGWRMKDATYAPVKTHKAIIRTTPDGKSAYVLNIVGQSYKLVHNHELFTHVEECITNQVLPPDLEDVRVTDSVSGWGRMCYRQYVFPRIKRSLGGSTRSDIAFRMIVQNGYGGSALRIHAGAIEFWCSNGMIRGEYQSTYRKHTRLLTFDGLSNAITKALWTFEEGAAVWQEWAKKPIQHQQAMDLFRTIAASPKQRETLANHYDRERDVRGDTLWTAYSTLTYYASHNEGDFSVRSSPDEHDTVASTMLQRELNVAKWVGTDAWRKLETT